MSLTDEFRQWLAAPERTVDELCTAEVLIESGESITRAQNKVYGTDWEAEARKRKERALNPAYRPKLPKARIERGLQFAELMRHFQGSHYEDRPIRSLAPLKFFPTLENVSATAEVTDFSALHALPKLQHLALQEPANGGHVMKDFSGLAGLLVPHVSLATHYPWADFRALAELPELTKLGVRANLMALRGVAPLRKVREATLDSDYHCNTPVRDFHDLPEMPEVRQLRVNSIGGLAGVERFTNVLSLDLVGPFQDLTPLSLLPNLTHLRLEGNWFMDLSPLAKIPRLREVVLVRERPLDLSPLSEAPALREVNVERCAIIRTELAALNAGLMPWSLDFTVPEPRKLEPVRAFCYSLNKDDAKEAMANREADLRAEAYGDDRHLNLAEGRWFGREIQQRLDALLGKGWGETATYTHGGGHHHLNVQRFKDVMRMDEIVQVCRELIATCKYPWNILVSAEPHGDLSKEMEEIRARREEEERDWLDQEYDEKQEREDYEEFRKSRRELYERLEREHRLRLLQQQGEEIDPADFSPATEKKAQAKGKDADDEDYEDEDEEDLAEDDEFAQSEFEEAMSFGFTLTERHIWVPEHDKETFEATVGIQLEDWHALPEPVAERPRPRLG
jgi:hypothetical protein